jgi:hypothetical protein
MLKVLAIGNMEYEHEWKKPLSRSLQSSFGPVADKAQDLLGEENWEDVLNRCLDILEKLDDVLQLDVPVNGMQNGGTGHPLRIPRTVSFLAHPHEMTCHLIQTRLSNRVEEIQNLQQKLMPRFSKHVERVIQFPPLPSSYVFDK